MKKNFFFLYLLMCSINGISQNLVPNPKFELYSNCPDGLSNPSNQQISKSLGWEPFKETPEYYNTCSLNSNISPPNCSFGFQYPHSGDAYAGIVVYNASILNIREFLGSHLISSLTTNQKYFISFYINLSGGTFWNSTIATNKIGVKFSTVPYSYSNPAPINNFAHFYTDSIITDTVKWTKISGSFIADSAYSYIIIGNFFNDILTDTINLSTGSNSIAYYYLDDVCVTTDSLFNANWTGITGQTINKSNNITIYPIPANDYIIITSENNEAIKQIAISDLTGRVVYKKNYQNELFETSTDLTFLPASTYFISISTANNIYNKKFVIVK